MSKTIALFILVVAVGVWAVIWIDLRFKRKEPKREGKRQ